MNAPKSVVVVGAGVAGLCCAYYLRKRDIDVVVLESNRVGSGASWGNGGWRRTGCTASTVMTR